MLPLAQSCSHQWLLFQELFLQPDLVQLIWLSNCANNHQNQMCRIRLAKPGFEDLEQGGLSWSSEEELDCQCSAEQTKPLVHTNIRFDDNEHSTDDSDGDLDPEIALWKDKDIYIMTMTKTMLRTILTMTMTLIQSPPPTTSPRLSMMCSSCTWYFFLQTMI